MRCSQRQINRAQRERTFPPHVLYVFRLTALPAAGVTFAVEAGNQQNAFGFHLVKQAIRKAPNPRPPAFPIDNGKTQRKFRDELDGAFDGLNESLGEMHADIGVPLLGVVKFRFRLVRPYNGQTHRLGSPAFTCSHGVPVGGFFSYAAMRRSSSSACSALSVDA
jgi:hypothetical protein